MWWRVSRVVRAATGDDGTGAVWPRLTLDGRQVIDLAFAEARELGHPCMAGEHLLLGLLRHGTSPAADLLRALGIDADEVRQGLEASFGADALHAAERRARRRPRWRSGHPRPSPLCVYLLAKRAMEFAARFAADRGDAGIGPQHLLYGVLLDARDPLGARRACTGPPASIAWLGAARRAGEHHGCLRSPARPAAVGVDGLTGRLRQFKVDDTVRQP